MSADLTGRAAAKMLRCRAAGEGVNVNVSANGKVAIVTGGGSGIGRAVGIAFLADGWRVALAGRHRASLDRTIEQAGADERNALAVVTDVTDPAAVQGLFARTVEAFGRVDVLFNNAGVSSPSTALEEVPFAEWSRVVATNLTGAFLCTQEAFRAMKSQRPRGGRIINNGSISAHTPRPNSVAYSASKHAISGLTKSAALEGREFDIACGQIDIGNARTELADGLIAAARASGRSPEPMIDVRHVAEAVLRMASLPLDANVLFMTIMATKMPYVGRG
ncbi:MAG TPA: SDR family oxidoreductase [Steroidobacteraceae bacterium]